MKRQSEKAATSRDELSPFERFERFMKALVAVPKKEIDRKLAYYERDKRTRQRKAAAKSTR